MRRQNLSFIEKGNGSTGPAPSLIHGSTLVHALKQITNMGKWILLWGGDQFESISKVWSNQSIFSPFLDSKQNEVEKEEESISVKKISSLALNPEISIDFVA